MLTTVQLDPFRPPRGLQNAKGRKSGGCILGQVIVCPKKAASPSPNPQHRVVRFSESNNLFLPASPWDPVGKVRQCCTPTCTPACTDVAASLRRRRPKLTLDVKMSDQGKDSKVVRDYEDWIKLKLCLAQALEAYESDNAEESISLLRSLINDYQRYLLSYHDPSVLFAVSNSAHIPQNVPMSLEETPARDWGHDNDCLGLGPQNKAHPHSKYSEPPTAFHTVLGIALFYFGNLIAQNPSLAEPGEYDKPVPYWLAALDVFETGESLPSRTNPDASVFPQDWRMAIMWGRTLVCLADEVLMRAEFNEDKGFDWPPNSTFTAIVSRRPPFTRRISPTLTSANDLLLLAVDQFSRGIFHLPHRVHLAQLHANPTPSSPDATQSWYLPEVFSRAKELFTIAEDVLCVAERLDTAADRREWALWADSVFNQMKMESDIDMWRVPIARARGRCWLIIGSTGIEEIESALEAGNHAILMTDAAQEARSGLNKAISFFERAKGWTRSESKELQQMLVEAVLTLANLTADNGQREELYAKAQKESEGHFDLDLEDRMEVGE